MENGFEKEKFMVLVLNKQKANKEKNHQLTRRRTMHPRPVQPEITQHTTRIKDCEEALKARKRQSSQREARTSCSMQIHVVLVKNYESKKREQGRQDDEILVTSSHTTSNNVDSD